MKNTNSINNINNINTDTQQEPTEEPDNGDVSIIRRRKDQLINELSLKHLPLRHDSRLCSSFIYGQLGDDWDVHRVVHECATMHWLYTYTLYPYQVREAYLYFSTILTSGRSVHEFIKHNVQPHIKGQTILQHGGIPSHWPWLPPTQKNKEPEESGEQVEEESLEQMASKTDEWLVVPG